MVVYNLSLRYQESLFHYQFDYEAEYVKYAMNSESQQ